ncbi:MAG TPA: response regulator transcription factor [Chitinophagaceae bacterium]|jgi:DNA-binding NarL/FixJ family response regulator|nr:response regulator transcription factor [Chitinophagaceae bacterium]
MNKISIIIAEDLKLIRDVWDQVFKADSRFEVLASCESGEKAFDMSMSLKPDVLITDINMKGVDGFELTRLIRSYLPATRILAVSMHIQVSYVRRIINLGAAGYVTKNSPVTELFTAVIDIYNGKKYICEEIRQSLAAQFTNDEQSPVSSLSVREMEIIDSVKDGLSSTEIAERFQLSKKTVEAHRYNIMKKLNVKNTAALVNFMNREG